MGWIPRTHKLFAVQDAVKVGAIRRRGWLGRMVERLRRILSVRHLTDEGHEPEIAAQMVRGRIDWDDSAMQRAPLLVIDGREISWDEFGRMLMGFEGWQFKLEIVDRSHEA